jgi:hypothetical protein
MADEAKYGGARFHRQCSDPRRASDPQDTYFAEHQRLQDESRIGATLWTWHESCGDPHKAGDVRAGNVPYVWGEFEVDCTTNTITGVRQDLVDALTRGYVRAAPGRLETTTWNPTGALTASGVDAPAVFTPSYRFRPSPAKPVGVIGATGPEDLCLAVTPAGDHYITRPLSAARATLTVHRAS